MKKKALIIIGVIIFAFGGFVGGILGWEMAQPTITVHPPSYMCVTKPFDELTIPNPATETITITWTKGGETITIVIPYDIDRANIEEGDTGCHWYYRWGYK